MRPDGREVTRAVYVISVAAELAGVHPQTLRIYERKGLIEPSRTEGRSRRYSDRDIALRVVADGMTSAQVRDAMSANPQTCGPDDSVKDVMRVMSDAQVRRIPIVDDGGTVVGIVSQADVVRQTDGERVEKTIEKISQPGSNN